MSTNEVLEQSTQVSLDCKRLLIIQALNQSPAPLVWGGDFSKSSMGNPALSSEVFSYIRAHPWIQILSIEDLTGSTESVNSGIRPDINTQQSVIDGTQPPELISYT